MTKGNAMVTAEADIRTEHAARYLARLCGHAGQMATASLDYGQWTMRALPGRREHLTVHWQDLGG